MTNNTETKGRYIYHYCGALKGQNATFSGVAQLTFRIASQQDLERFKGVASCEGNEISAVLSLSYLGREHE